MSETWEGRCPEDWVRILRGGMLVALTADGREGHRVRPWPDLTAEAWDPKRGLWRRNRPSAERLLELYGGGWPWGFNLPPVGNPSFAPPFASEPVGWSERESGQYLMPFFPDSPDACREFAAARAWETMVAFRATLPADVRAAVAPFALPPLRLLRLLALEPGLVRLTRENPAVALFLAWSDPEPAQLADLARATRRDLMKALGLPPVAFGFLSRVEAEGLEADDIRNLALAVTQPVFGKCLLHLDPVPYLVVRMVMESATWALLTPDLIRQVARRARLLDSPLHWEAAHFVDRLVAWRRRVLSQRAMPRLRAIGELPARQLRLRYGGNPRPVLSTDDATPLPPPPVPGSASLIPLRTVGEAVREGLEQRNCVGTEEMLGEVHAGYYAIYRTVAPAPARLTVLLWCRPETGEWVVRDARMARNGLPGFGTMRWVTEQLGLPAEPDWLPRDSVFLPPGATCAFPAPVKKG